MIDSLLLRPSLHFTTTSLSDTVIHWGPVSDTVIHWGRVLLRWRLAAASPATWLTFGPVSTFRGYPKTYFHLFLGVPNGRSTVGLRQPVPPFYPPALSTVFGYFVFTVPYLLPLAQISYGPCWRHIPIFWESLFAIILLFLNPLLILYSRTSFITNLFYTLRTKVYLSDLNTQFISRRRHSLPRL
jgi:hypothetical protein